MMLELCYMMLNFQILRSVGRGFTLNTMNIHEYPTSTVDLPIENGDFATHSTHTLLRQAQKKSVKRQVGDPTLLLRNASCCD